MCKDKDIFEQIGRVDPLNDDKTYSYTDKFKKFYLTACTYFMENSGDNLYGICMKPYKNDAIISVKAGGIWPFAEETQTTIENIFEKCNNVSFKPQKGYMVIKLRYKNALQTISDDEI